MPGISVIVPSYRRPDDLARCLQGLRAQTRLPDEVVVVLRRDDEDSERVARAELETVLITFADVPGQVAALNAGRHVATQDFFVFTDDDAVPQPAWLSLIEEAFAQDGGIGAVGGRDIVHQNGEVLHGHVDLVGQLLWWGRAVGNHHLQSGAQDVDFLKGVNMAFRSVALSPFCTDLRGRGAQTCNDLEASWSARRRGWRVVWDPAIVVDHFPARRFDGDRRSEPTVEARSDYAHNELFALALHAGLFRAVLLSFYRLTVGTRAHPGVLMAAASAGDPFVAKRLFAARLSAMGRVWVRRVRQGGSQRRSVVGQNLAQR